MSRNRVLAARTLVGLLFLALLLGFAPANAAGGASLRVLLTGDSITQGFNGDYTWRYRLDKEFVRQGRAVDFVGSRRSPNVKPGFSSSRYADPNFDQDHFAWTGYTLSGLAAKIGDEVAKQQPDVVVLLAGVNDLRGNASPEDTDAALNRWIDRVRGAKPDVRMIISPVLDARDTARPDLPQKIQRYDGLAKATVARRSTTESPISWADTTNGWSVAAHTSEYLHPNPTGDTVIAQRIGESFARIGILAGPIKIFHANTVWDLRPRVRVVMTGNHRAVLTWDRQAITGARVWIKRAGNHRAYYPYTRFGAGTMTTARLVPRAVYDFRVQLFRGSMVTPVGPATRLTVPRTTKPAAVAKVTVDSAGVHWTASALAARYLVKFRKAGSKRWFTRRTAGLAVSAPRVIRAKVWAINDAGRSRVRVGGR